MKSPIQHGKPMFVPIHYNEEEKAAKVVTKNTDEKKVIHQLTWEPRVLKSKC